MVALNLDFSGHRVSRGRYHGSASAGPFGFYTMQKCAINEGKTVIWSDENGEPTASMTLQFFRSKDYTPGK